MNTQG